MSFSETIFLFFLALVIFGPKKLPEIARQAGKLLAELRRASNEFKSQIETEIAVLETKKQEVLPPSGPPPGAVASLSLNPKTSETVLQESRATLAAPAEATLAGSSSAMTNLAAANVVAENSHTQNSDPGNSHSAPGSEPLTVSSRPVSDTEVVPAAQDSHA